MDKKLTESQQKVYDYIVESAPFSPTVREIAAAVGLKSPAAVYKILGKLADFGLINKTSHASRGISLKNIAKATNVPLIGKVTAGAPILATESIEGYLPMPSEFGNASELFALRVSGFSMKNAGILDGDIVIADKDAECRSGDIVVALIDEEATVKRLGFEGKSPVLYPENPDFEPIYPEELSILGKIVGSYRKY